MRFNIPSLNPDVVLQLSPRCVKGIAYGDINVFMSLLVIVLLADGQFFVRRGDVNANVVLIALVMVMMFRFNGNPATHNIRRESLQLGGFFTNSSFHSVRMGYSTER